MSDEDFRGPIGRVEKIVPRIQEAGILLDMQIRYPGETAADPLSREAVLVPPGVGFGLPEELAEAMRQWRAVYRRQ